MNTPTPRTDAEQDDARNVALEFTCRNPPPKDGENVMVVPAEFSRQIERELNLALEYARHSPVCAAPSRPCDCGLDEFLERVCK